MFLNLLLVCRFTLIIALETPILSKHLQPRDFNPHPYDGLEFNNLGKTGPVEFPKNSDDEFQLLNDDVEFVSEAGKRERFSGTDQEVLGPAYGSLSEHARKVLNSNQLQIEQDQHNEEDDYIEESNEIKAAASNNKLKKYQFSYAVKDGQDDFSHTQRRNSNGAVHGSYKVQLPDGRVQIVRYIADDDGYRADVIYENNGIVTNNLNSNNNYRTRSSSHSGHHRTNKLSSRYQHPQELTITPRPKYSSKHRSSDAFRINPRVDSRAPAYGSFLEDHQPISYYQKSTIAPTAADVPPPVFFISNPQSTFNNNNNPYQDINISPNPHHHFSQNYYFHNPLPSTLSPSFSERDY
jgi:hypothetical protein